MIDFFKDFRNNRYAKILSDQIREIAPLEPVNFMEICGGHTIAIFKYGIRQLLPSAIKLLSGPGCPVCVTGKGYIDRAIALSRLKNVMICTFGDMLKVPGSSSSLMQEKAAGGNIRICLSPAEAVVLAEKNSDKKIIFLAIGFETTAPTIAASLKMADDKKIRNLYILSALKTMPNALEALISSEDFKVNGFICPGHVAAVTGAGLFRFISAKYKLPAVVSGFEPLDILQTIQMLSLQINERRADMEIQYTRSVTSHGNPVALELLEEVFSPCDDTWRGLGTIPGSGLQPSIKYQCYDARLVFDIQVPEAKDNPACLCGEIMRGVKTPIDCKLFAKSCIPASPQGACMVSGEGTCAAYFKYNRG